MKKIIIIAALGTFVFVSCKKDRTCTCTVTQLSSTADGKPQAFSTAPTTVTYNMEKTTKNGSHCFANTVTDTYESNGHTTVDVTKYDCKLD